MFRMLGATSSSGFANTCSTEVPSSLTLPAATGPEDPRQRLMGARPMPQYIMLVNFTDQGLKGVKDVPSRQDKSRNTAKQFGVERKTVWMTFGPYDFVHHYEAPNDEAMAKFVMTLSSFGNARTPVMRAWDETEHLPLIRELS
jgi:uncharacterized protein with GYD domain